MCISGPMVRESKCRYGDQGLFPGRPVYEFTFHLFFVFCFFEDSNEEIMGREQKQKVLW